MLILSLFNTGSKIMNYDKNPIIIPFLKMINGIQLVMWDYVQRAYLYDQFTMMSDDYAKYTPIRFEKL
jgi:hypothetical protein